MKRFVLYWGGDMEPEVIKGESISGAFSAAGYSSGAIGALDYYASEQAGEENLTDNELIAAHRR